MWKNPAGYFVGCAVALNAPWSARTSTRSARMRPSRSAAILPLHQVVAGEAGGGEVLRPVLHPLDRLAGEDRADDGADVARVDRDLVAEAAADVGRDDLDLVLGQAGHERVQRAVGVRRLRRAPQPQLAGDRVHVGDRAARLQRAGVDALERDVLRDEDDVGVLEDRVRLGLVAGLPVEDVVVGLALLVVADDRRVGVERLARVDEHGQRLVLDVDQLERVARRVVVVRDHEGHLLALEAHLVRGEHGLRVGRERRHPGEPEPLEVLAGDHRAHLRVLQRGRRVDGDDAGVRQRAAQHRAVQHPGQLHVVDVVALAADEPRVLLALQPAEADGALVGDGHREPPRCPPRRSPPRPPRRARRPSGSRR